MRALALLLTLAGFVLPAFGAKRVTVDELEQTLAATLSLPDAEVAKQLSDLELSERLSTARLDRLETKVPGEKARQALTILADASAFLDPPAAEISAQTAPDLAAQRKILALTVNYVTQTVHQLPNFFATRTTTSFEDTPNAQRPGAISAQGLTSVIKYQTLHLVGATSVMVLYRDGHEVVQTIADKVKNQPPAVQTLTTSGVFGPILGTVLVDAARSNLAWSHWEQGHSGPEAVFSYKVPKEKSHYTVTYYSRPTDPSAADCSTKAQAFSPLVAYHGEMAVDPASGTILRLVLVADLKPDDFTVKSGIVVEYGEVSIGGRTYIVPVKSISSTLARSIQRAQMNPGCFELLVREDLKASLNDVVFGQYHVFRADATMLSEREAEKLETQPPATNDSGPTRPEEAQVTSAAAAIPTIATSAESVSPGNSQAAPAASSAASPSAATPPTTLNSEMEAEQASLLHRMPVYRTNARDVIVDVVVTKSNGDPVLGLTKQDFGVKEDGKPQAIDFLEEHTATPSPLETPQTLPKLPLGTYTNAPPVPLGDSVNVLLLDTLNTPQPDQAYVHNEIRNYLKAMQPGTRVAIFALGSKLRFVQGFTTDTAVLLAALNGKRNGAAPVKEGGSRDSGDQADDAAEVARLTMMQSPAVIALEAAQSDMRSFDFGTRASITFEALDHLALYLAGIPGRKNLIWFSSSFPVVIFPSVAQRTNIENLPNMQGYLDQVRKTANMFTVSQVSVYPVDAQGVMAEHIGEADSAGPGAPEGVGHIGSVADGTMSNGTMTPFLAGAGDHANTISAMEQLAASTGGKAYFNTNDLNGALRRAILDGANYYTLSYSPTNAKTDGTYRKIEVHLAKGHFTLAYRRGYNADTTSSLKPTPGTDPLAPVMKLGLPSATSLMYGVRAVPMTTQPSPDAARAGQNSQLSGTTVRYSVDFFIRLTDMTFQPGPEGEHDGKMELDLMVYDHDGNAVNWDGITQTMNLQPAVFDAMQKSGLRAHMEIDLPEKDVYLVTGVYDWGSGKTGSLEIPLHPGLIAQAQAVR
jgi:VWFA-related protein